MRTEIEQAISLIEKARYLATAWEKTDEIKNRCDLALSQCYSVLMLALRYESDLVRERLAEHEREAVGEDSE